MTSKTLMVSLDFCPSPACYSGLAHCSLIRTCHPVSGGPTSINTTFIFLSILGGLSPHSLLSLFKSHLFFTKLPPPKIFPGCSNPRRQPRSKSVIMWIVCKFFSLHCVLTALEFLPRKIFSWAVLFVCAPPQPLYKFLESINYIFALTPPPPFLMPIKAPSTQ